jgi:fluoride ion exporter CrcB/FEX
MIMGFLSEDKSLFREEWGHSSPSSGPRPPTNDPEHTKKHKAVKKTIPLYIGLTTGFCGCFTSFSSFIRDTFLALANALPDPSLPTGANIQSRNGGYSFMALVAVILFTVSLSLSGLIFGAHLALALGRYTPTVPFALTRRVLDRGVVVLGWGGWLGAVFLAIWPPDRYGGKEVWRGRAVFALVFAPLGCLVRFYVSLMLNARVPAFPMGTFMVNMFGTAVEGMCFDLQHVGGLGALSGSLVGCQVLQGVMDGFCGSVTTVSTWVSELNGLGKMRHAYVYGVGSVGCGLGLLVIIMGSLLWTRGFEEPVCS